MNYSRYLAADKFVLFLLHGVVAQSNYRIRNYTRKHVKADDFDCFLSDLLTIGVPVSIDAFLESQSGGPSLPSHPFAITFDDGFENNHSQAAPILRQRGVPATFYVTSGFVDQNEMSWIDKIELCIERFCPSQLYTPWHDKPFRFSGPESEKQFLDEVRHLVKASPDLNPEEVVAEFYDQCHEEVVEQSYDPLDLKMSWAQVAELANDPLFTVGAHTHSHAILGYLEADRIRSEISTSLSMLREHTGLTEVRHFSYPEGFEGSYNQATIEILREEGVLCSPTAIEGVNSFDANPFHLRRVFVT